MNIVQDVFQTQSQQPTLRTPPYVPAQTPNVQPSTSAIDTIHANQQTHPATSRTLSRPPSPVIRLNPLSYNLSSTNASNIQQPTSLQLNALSTSQITEVPSTTIRTNPKI